MFGGRLKPPSKAFALYHDLVGVVSESVESTLGE
jgi:hypothetical protein